MGELYGKGSANTSSFCIIFRKPQSCIWDFFERKPVHHSLKEGILKIICFRSLYQRNK